MATITAQVVEGEASESDTEIEIGKSANSSLLSQSSSMNAFVVAGEAPESDDESKIQSLSEMTEADIVIRDDTMSSPPPTPSKINHASLLYQKLWECNVSLRATVECLLKHTTDLAIDKLTKTDKTLLNVQESMRSTNANLTLARTKLKQIQAGLEKAGCGTALQNVRPSNVSEIQ